MTADVLSACSLPAPALAFYLCYLLNLPHHLWGGTLERRDLATWLFFYLPPGGSIRTWVLGESPAPHRGHWPGRCPARVFSRLVGKPERGPKWQVGGLLGGTEGASFPEKASDMSDWRQESDRRGHEHRMQTMAIATLRPGHQPGSHPKAGRGREQK